jgi:subtilase family serine protease
MRPYRSAAAMAALTLTMLGSVVGGHCATAAPAAKPTPTSKRVCPEVKHGAACMAWIRTDIAPQVIGPSASPAGYGPATLRSAYNLTASGSALTTIAVVDAFDDPNAEADLAVYRSTFGLTPCTTANGCFKKVGQTGGAVPTPDVGWAEEESLDIDMASAICPNCHILLVEATTNTFVNLGTAVNYAAAHAIVVGNSYGGPDTSDVLEPYYNHPGVAITASSGDSGFGVEFPASSHYTTAVGGTHLVMSGTTRVSETAWSGTGSGCSAVNGALLTQKAFDTGCAGRAVADVSAVADPATGVATYDTYGGLGGWLVFGGTSVAAQVIAGIIALRNGNENPWNNNNPYTQYAGNFFDITSGSNGNCSPTQLCTAGLGWDGPTGLGTPNGTGGF